MLKVGVLIVVIGAGVDPSRRGTVPAWLGGVHPGTRTPVASTLLCVSPVIILSTTLPIVTLAESASMVTLAVFAIVNSAPLRLKARSRVGLEPPFTLAAWIPALGLIASLVQPAFGPWQRLDKVL